MFLSENTVNQAIQYIELCELIDLIRVFSKRVDGAQQYV